jgi:2-polyprenyl-3-methyl-5-hydroxy-6-metoxy-1,4-benzoquinol methylase
MNSINRNGAMRYWEERVWQPPNFKGESEEIQKMAKLILQVVREHAPENLRILEVGCGAGNLTVNVLSELNRHKQYDCLDVSQAALDVLERRVSSLFPDLSAENFRTHCAYFNGSGFFPDRQGQFDVIACARVLNHIPNIHEFFQGIAKSLKHKGVFVCDAIPGEERPIQLRQNYGWKASLVQTVYNGARGLSERRILSELFSRSGLLRSHFPAIPEIFNSLEKGGLKLGLVSMDYQTHYYRFVAKKVN